MQYICHERFMDIAILLKAPIRKTRTGYEVTGKYVNQGFVETFELGVPVKIVIGFDKIAQWLVCDNPSEACIRYATWRPAVWRPNRRKL